MDRRAFITTFGGSILAVPLATEAQQVAKVARIGFLSINLAAAPPNLHEAFRQGLRDLGYVEGRDVVIDYRDAGGKEVENLFGICAVGVTLPQCTKTSELENAIDPALQILACRHEW